jgi:acetolactate synthase-1/3 small subunit
MIPTSNEGKHTISIRVHDRPGVLSRISQVFARRGFNIDSLVVSRGHTSGFSRMTIVCEGDPGLVDQIVKQLAKLVDTVHAAEHLPQNSVERELALVKVEVKQETRSEILQFVEVFRGKIVDISEGSMVAEITGNSAKIDAFEQLLSQFGIIEMVRSGKVIIARGPERT